MDEVIFEFYFSDEHNKDKQQNFYEEKKFLEKLQLLLKKEVMIMKIQ